MSPTPRSHPSAAGHAGDGRRAVGVSRMTISNAYNRPDQLSPELRERILAAAHELGYSGPNPVARTLSRGRASAIGFVLDYPLTRAFTDPATMQLLQGVAGGCEERGLGLSLVPKIEGRDAALVQSALVDGFVVFCTREDDPRVVAVRERRLPYVLIDYAPGGSAWWGSTTRAARAPRRSIWSTSATAPSPSCCRTRSPRRPPRRRSGCSTATSASPASRAGARRSPLRASTGPRCPSPPRTTARASRRRRRGPPVRPRRPPHGPHRALRPPRARRPRRRGRARHRRPRPALDHRLRRHPRGGARLPGPHDRAPAARAQGRRGGPPPARARFPTAVELPTELIVRASTGPSPGRSSR